MLRPKGMGSMLKCWASSKLLRRRRSLSSVRPSVSRRRHRPPLVFADSTGIIGIATSKACVAFFLLRIVVILWHQIVLWVCVIAAAVICILCALFDFIRCDPVEGVWNPTVKATCWMGTEAFTDLSVGVGGQYAFFVEPSRELRLCYSDFRHLRLRTGSAAMGNPLGPQYEEEGKEDNRHLHESWRLVSSTSSASEWTLTVNKCWGIWDCPRNRVETSVWKV